jgi:hypothetical protein
MTPAPPLQPCPLPIAEQTTRILEIAPLGTSRDEAVKRLEDAGIIGNFSTGSSKSTYYCDIWPQEGDLRWHINVVLLFDESGILYGTLPQLPTTAKRDITAETGTNSVPADVTLVPLQ